MADIYFYQTDTDEDNESGYSDSSSSVTGNQDDGLTPVDKLEKYADSENIFNRQMVARTVLETLRQVEGSSLEVDQVFSIVERLAGDTEPSVRAELMEQVPHIAMFCQEQESPSIFSGTVPVHLLPLVVRFLTDSNNQVRKTSQAALLVLLEQGLVETKDVVDQVCPVILRLTDADSVDDYRTEAVALLSKMAPLIGKENSEKIFLDRFAALCTDPLFHVRKVCAANFGDFSGVVGSESTEQILLPKFFYLCEDGVWGVRKACADVFMPVSCVCSPTIRQAELSPLFINLLKDQSRWVRMAAFQALGPFISTFADPLITALLHNENGEIVITDTDQLAERLAKVVESREKEEQKDISENGSSEKVDKSKGDSSCTDSKNVEGDSRGTPMDMSGESDWSAEQVTNMEGESPEERRAVVWHEKNMDYYSFMYWREPVSDLGLDDIETLEDRDVIKTNVEEMKDSKPGAAQMATYSDTTKKENVSLHEATIEVVKNELSSLDSESSTDEVTVAIEAVELKSSKTENDVNETDTDSSKEAEKNEQDKSLQDDPDSILEAHISDTIDKVDSSGDDESTTVEATKSENELINSSDDTDSSNPGDNCDSITSDANDDDSKPTYAEAVKTSKEPELQIGRWESYGARSSLHSSKSSLDSLSLYQSGGSDLQPQDLALPRGPPQTCQSIVPQLLIDHYVSMIDPSRAQTVDNDIARHCAFSLPAVALTLGRTNWPLIKETYETLANDMQWKVRRTVASSIHELGVILGEDIAAEDLVPIFDGFIKDLDEVRIGALKHLSNFLALLATEARNAYLPRLGEFLKMDNERNWRFRLELTEQLGHMLALFSAKDVREHLGPIVLQLVQDKVAAVRVAAAAVLSGMLSQLHSLNQPDLATSLATNLVEVLGRSTHWARRQTYAVLCGEVVKVKESDDKTVYSPSSFSTELLPHLLDLTWDKVPNVRLAVAKVVVELTPQHHSNCKELVDAAMAQLKQDKDRNVREVAGEEESVTQLISNEITNEEN